MPESSASALELNLTADQLHDRGEYLSHRLAELNSWLAAAERQKRELDPTNPVQRPNIERLEHEITGLQEDIGHVTAETLEHDAEVHRYRRKRDRHLGGVAGLRARWAALRS